MSPAKRATEPSDALRRWLLRLLFPSLALVPGALVALSTDAEQPIEIEADFAELDETEGRTVYRGNVEVRQGSLHMKGDVLRALFDENDTLTEVRITGEPAWFKQTPDDSAVDIEGEALTIDYRQADNLLKLIDQAKLTKGGQLFQGNEIDYDTERSVIRARAARPSTDTDAPAQTSGSGRVRIIIPPKQKDPAP